MGRMRRWRCCGTSLVTRKQARLIERAVLVVVPIYNADGHEHFGPFNRINQNGPEQMGWRTNATGQNLNRDYMKADAPETRGFLREWRRWLPDFFVDDHVTVGADYQYDVTFSIETDGPASGWVRKTLEPELFQRVTASGHLIAPYLEFVGSTPDTGITAGVATPRFSTGFAMQQNRPGMLVEMHMLKDYQTRVTGNYELLRALLEVVNRDATKLVEANQRADRETIARGLAHREMLALKYEATGETEPFAFKGYRWTVEHSDISGADWVQYSHEPVTTTVPMADQAEGDSGGEDSGGLHHPGAVDRGDCASGTPRAAAEAAGETLDRRGRDLPLRNAAVADAAFRGASHCRLARGGKNAGLHADAREDELSRRFGGGADGAASGTHRHTMAGAGGAGFGVALGILRQHF